MDEIENADKKGGSSLLLMKYTRMTGWLLILIWLLANPFSLKMAWAGADQEYETAKAALTRFEKHPNLHKYRDKWFSVISRFERIVKRHPNHRRTCDSLYNIGNLYMDLSLISYADKDRRAAIQAFEKLSARCGDTRLADDGLYWAATMSVKLGEKNRAKELLTRALERFPKGDMHAKSKKLLLELGGQWPLPHKEMTKRTAKANSPHPTEADLASSSGKLIQPSSDVVRVKTVQVKTTTESTQLKMVLSRFGSMSYGSIPATNGSPRRVYFDFSETKLDPGVPTEVAVDDARIARVRLGQYQDNVVRIVFETTPGAGKFHFTNGMSPPSATITFNNVEIKGATAPVDARQTDSSSDPIANLIPSQTRSTSSRDVKLVVIDPGHGGDDDGARGASGTREKDIVLKLSKRLKRILEKEYGIQVVLTRKDDTYLPLFDRTDIANERNADLFVSIHCNANRKRKHRGIETFYLNNSTDRYSERLATRENQQLGKQVSDLEFILSDLSMNVNVADSIMLADLIQKSMVKRATRLYKDTVDRGVRRALFHVLLYARMPAVLVEASFISNPTEEKRLRSEKYQETLAKGIAAGIARYADKQKKLARQP